MTDYEIKELKVGDTIKVFHHKKDNGDERVFKVKEIDEGRFLVEGFQKVLELSDLRYKFSATK